MKAFGVFVLLCLGAAVAAQAAPPTPAIWDVDGTILPSGKAHFDPLFTTPVDNARDRIGYAALASGALDKGDYSVEVRDIRGKVKFTCHFTPGFAIEESTHGNGSALSQVKSFNVQLPVFPGAAALVLKDPKNTELGRIKLGGSRPQVSILSPAAGFIGNGTQRISWKVKPSRPEFTSRVLFSADGGAQWAQRGDQRNGTSLLDDFDQLPGSEGQALIRVLVSDGVNTGVATSRPFSIPRKNTIRVVMTNPDGHLEIKSSYHLSSGRIQYNDAFVFLSGQAYSVDDSMLRGEALQWSSSLQGKLGAGEKLEAHLKPGHHIITLRATDTRGHSATVTGEITITPP